MRISFTIDIERTPKPEPEQVGSVEYVPSARVETVGTFWPIGFQPNVEVKS